MKVKAIIPFAYLDPENGHISVNEGDEVVIDDAEAKRLADAGIVEFASDQPAKPSKKKIETASAKPSIETADVKVD